MSAPTQDPVVSLPGIASPHQGPDASTRTSFGPTRSLHNAVSRTWELEMLISGAVLFGLFQLPGLLDGLNQQVMPHLTERLGPIVFLAHVFSKIIVYATIVIFSLHLVARAYWVGLIGLDSVFPDGIRWDRVTYGPTTRSVYRERMSSIPAVIARIDRFCSVLFSFGFLIALTCLFALVGGLLAMAVDLLESWFSSGRRADRALMPIILLGIAGTSIALHLADRLLGDRLDPEGWPARLLRKAVQVQYRIAAAPSYMMVFLTLVTNLPKRLVSTVFYTAIFALTVVVVAEALVDAGRLRLGNSAYFPDIATGSMVAGGFYENQRNERDAYRGLPSIQADVIEGPYVRLFIPYSPDRHNAAVAAQCPGTSRLNPGGIRLVPRTPAAELEAAGVDVLRCLAQIHQVTLNGREMNDLELNFHAHPATGIPGVLAYIATDELPRGRNLLTVRPAPRRANETAEPEPPFHIPFWR